MIYLYILNVFTCVLLITNIILMLRAKVYLKDENHSLVNKVIEAAKIRNSVNALGQGDIMEEFSCFMKVFHDRMEDLSRLLKHDNGFLFGVLGEKIDKIENLLEEKHYTCCKEKSFSNLVHDDLVAVGIIEEEKKPAKKKKGKKATTKKEVKETKEIETKE